MHKTRIPGTVSGTLTIKYNACFRFTLVLQEHQSHREHVRVCGHVRRRLAQLSPHLPLGLQECRATRLQTEPVHAFHRRFLVDRMGLRPEDRAHRTGEQACPAHR